jgi:hypothetical protein
LLTRQTCLSSLYFFSKLIFDTDRFMLTSLSAEHRMAAGPLVP